MVGQAELRLGPVGHEDELGGVALGVAEGAHELRTLEAAVQRRGAPGARGDVVHIPAVEVVAVVGRGAGVDIVGPDGVHGQRRGGQRLVGVGRALCVLEVVLLLLEVRVVLAALGGHQGAAVCLQALGSGQLRGTGVLGPVVELIAGLVHGRGAEDLVARGVADVAVAVAGGAGRASQGATIGLGGRGLGVIVNHVGNRELLNLKDGIEVEDAVRHGGVEGELRHQEGGRASLLQRGQTVVGPALERVAVVHDVGGAEQRGALTCAHGHRGRGRAVPLGLGTRRGVGPLERGLGIGALRIGGVVALERVDHGALHGLPEGAELVVLVHRGGHGLGGVGGDRRAVVHVSIVGEVIVPVRAVPIAPASEGPAVGTRGVAGVLVAGTGLEGAVIGDVLGRGGRRRAEGGVDDGVVGQAAPQHLRVGAGGILEGAMRATRVGDRIGVGVHGTEGRVCVDRIGERITLADDELLAANEHGRATLQHGPAGELVGAVDDPAHVDVGELRGRRGETGGAHGVGYGTAVVHREAAVRLAHAATVSIGAVGRHAVDEVHGLGHALPGADKGDVLVLEGELIAVLDDVIVVIAEEPAGEDPGGGVRGSRRRRHGKRHVGVVGRAVGTRQRVGVARHIGSGLRSRAIGLHELVVQRVRQGHVVERIGQRGGVGHVDSVGIVRASNALVVLVARQVRGGLRGSRELLAVLSILGGRREHLDKATVHLVLTVVVNRDGD